MVLICWERNNSYDLVYDTRHGNAFNLAVCLGKSLSYNCRNFNCGLLLFSKRKTSGSCSKEMF